MRPFLIFVFLLGTLICAAQPTPVKDSTGKYMYARTDWHFDTAHPFEYGLAVVKQDNRWFVIDTDMTMRSPEADSIDRTFNTHFQYFRYIFLLKSRGGWFLYNTWKNKRSAKFKSVVRWLPAKNKILVLNQNNRQALLDVDNFYLSEPFDTLLAGPFDDIRNHFWVMHNKQFHLTDKKGESEAIFDDVKPLLMESGYFAYARQGLWHVRYGNRTLNKKGVNDSDFFFLPDIALGILRMRGKVYFVDGIWFKPARLIKGNLHPSDDYEGDDAQGSWNMMWHEDSTRISFKRQQFGFMDKWLRVTIPEQYDSVHSFYGDSVTAAKKYGRWGLINRQGSFVLTPTYRSIDVLNNAYAIAQHPNGQWGIINTRGEILAPFIHSRITYTLSGIILYNDSMVSLLSINSPPATLIKPFKGTINDNPKWDLFLFGDTHFRGIYDARNGRERFRGQYDDLKPISRTYCRAIRDNKTLLIDSTGQVVFSGMYTNLTDLGHGLFGVQQYVGNGNKKYRVYNLENKTFLPEEYDNVYEFSEGLAMVSVKNHYGYINTKGEMVIRPRYWHAQGFNNGKAYVYRGPEKFYINLAGKRLPNKKGR